MTPFSELQLDGWEQTIGAIVMLITIGGLVLTVLGAIYAIRAWMAQSAAFQTRKDVTEIKQMLQTMARPVDQLPRPYRPAGKDESITDGPKIASQ